MREPKHTGTGPTEMGGDRPEDDVERVGEGLTLDLRRRKGAAADGGPDPDDAPAPVPAPADAPRAAAPSTDTGSGPVTSARRGSGGAGGSGGRPPEGDGASRRSPWKKRIVLALLGLVLLGGLAGGAAVVGVFWYYGDDPEMPTFDGLEDYRPPLVTDVYSGENQLIGEFYVERRRTVPYHRVPKKLVQAFIATEDSRFFDHFGIDPLGMVKAVVEKVLHGGQLRGASTLTQQTAKAILVSEWGFEKASARTIRRKVIEMDLAMRLEELFTKEEILGIYLNHVYLGHHSYGVQSAAENYFRKNVWDLSLGEMALLAGLPQAPSRYSPWSDPERARKRRAYVLNRMYKEGMISEGERDAASEEPIDAHPVEDVFRETSPFFTEQVRRYVVDRYGNDRLLHDGLKVYGTVDLEKQRYAQEAMIDGLALVDKRQGYAGPLAEIPKEDWEAFADTYDEKVLQGANLEPEHTYVGLVTKVTADGATVRVGRHEGYLPIAAMRWAREPNPEQYYPYALIGDARQALSRGDAILVSRTDRDQLEELDPTLARRIPKKASLLLSLEQEPELQGALVSLDPNSSYVMAMIGGLDFELSEFNRAFQACRQPGSAFKPIVYSAAIEQLGWTPSTLIIDAPIVFDDPGNEMRWKPNNYGMDFKGEVTLRTALTKSMNVPAVKTLEAVGVGNAVEWAHKLGISSELNRDLSIALGSSCVTPWELTRVYAMFNRYGKRVDPVFVRRVVDRDGNVLEDRTVYFDPWAGLGVRIAAGHARLYEEPEQVVPEDTAYLMTSLLHHVVLSGTGVRAKRLGKPAAGKTGTTNDSFDAWFMGFTRDLVTGVWIGYDTYAHPMARYENGGHSALPIWLDYMQQALDGREQGGFDLPPSLQDDIVFVDVDVETGKLAGADESGETVRFPYKVGTEPTQVEGEVTVEQTGSSDFFMYDSEL